MSEKIYVVMDEGQEHSYIMSIHKTYNGALKAWNTLRRDLLDRARHSHAGETSKKLVNQMVKNLSCEDPTKIDNFPHATPMLHEFDLED